MNILIVEDEAHTASLLKEIIEQDSNYLVTEILESVVEAVEYLNKYQSNLDLLFFDIQLADGQSFEIFRHVDVTVPVVFCTAFDEYTLQAIKNNGIDYVLKPFKEEEIHTALQRFQQFIGRLSAKKRPPIQFIEEEARSYQKSFLTQYREKTIIKRVEDIALFTVENETVYLHTFSGEKLPVFKKMEYIESVCDPQQFFRINRQMLVHRRAVLSFETYFNRKIVLELKVKPNEKAVVSRLKVTDFKKWLEQ